MLPTIFGLLALASPSPSFVTHAPTAAPTPAPDNTSSKDDWVWVVVTLGVFLLMIGYCFLYVCGRREQPEQQGNIQQPLLQERVFVLAPVPVSKKRGSQNQEADEYPSQ